MRFTIIGAGHGGQALAGYASYMGQETTLYNRTESVLANIRNNEGIELTGCVKHKAQNIFLTNTAEEALNLGDVIMVSVPANVHEDIAKIIAPHIKNTHIIIINPGRTLGAYYFKKYLKKYNCCSEPVIAETDTFTLTSRKISDGKSTIISFKKQVFIASDTKDNTKKSWSAASKIFPMLKPAQSYVYTSMSNIGAIFHPLPAVFNISRIENHDRFQHYLQGITPSICHLIEKIDVERITLAEKLGTSVPDVKTWLKNVYGSDGETFYQSLQATSAYKEVIAPTDISTRYIYEDIPTGIVPMYCMAKEVGSPNKILGLIIDLATEMFEYDFYGTGRNDVGDFLATINKKESS